MGRYRIASAAPRSFCLAVHLLASRLGSLVHFAVAGAGASTTAIASSSAIDGHSVFSMAVMMFAFRSSRLPLARASFFRPKAEPKSMEGKPSSGGK